MVKLIKTESRMVVAGTMGGELLFNGYKVIVVQNELVIEICGTTWCLELTIQYCALKNLLVSSFHNNYILL